MKVLFFLSWNNLGIGHGGLYLLILATALGDNINIPWPASPPKHFCQEKVVASNFDQSNFIANAAEVASQIVIPSLLGFIQSALGTHTPAVVPFQLKTISPLKFSFDKPGKSPYLTSEITTSFNFNCDWISFAQSELKLSQTSILIGLVPRRFHIAISMAPVSDPGTMPTK